MAQYTQQQITEIISAIASGAERVSYGDKSVEYRSLSDLRQLLSTMTDDVMGTPARRSFRMYSPAGKGL